LRVDLARSLRRIKPERFTLSLTRRDDADLDFVEAAPSLGSPLLLDTCVYIDGLEGNLPPGVETLLRARTLMHLSVVLGELSHNFGRLDPGHPHTQEHLDELARMIEDVPRHRLDDAVSAGVLLEAGILSGLVANGLCWTITQGLTDRPPTNNVLRNASIWSCCNPRGTVHYAARSS
jgi:hypothetical protein